MPAETFAPPEIHQRIAGFEKLTGLFGYWPGFEDAEILSLRVARQGGEKATGPVLTLHLRAFAWGHDAASGHTVIDHQCVVTLRFIDVDDLHLAGLDSQNAIHQLRVGVEDPTSGPGRLIVSFPAARGLSGRFSCDRAEVAAVRLGLPSASDFGDAL